jgi:hypothetical protein
VRQPAPENIWRAHCLVRLRVGDVLFRKTELSYQKCFVEATEPVASTHLDHATAGMLDR